MKFRDFLNEDNTELKMEIYKFLKKKYKKTFNFISDEFKETDTVEFKHKNDKVLVYINDKDYNKPEYNFEWK